MNYKEQIKTLLNDNGLKLHSTSGRGGDYKAIYYSGKAPSGCDFIEGKNFKECLSKLKKELDSWNKMQKKYSGFIKEVVFFDANFNKIQAKITNKEEKLRIYFDDMKPADEHQKKLLELQEKWDLNDMHRGTEKQEEALKSKKFLKYFGMKRKNKKSHSDCACFYLKKIGLYIESSSPLCNSVDWKDWEYKFKQDCTEIVYCGDTYWVY